MIFPSIDSLDYASSGIDPRLAANIAHAIRVDWVDFPWPMSRDQWADWWAEGLKHQPHMLPALSEAQLAALTEAYSYVIEAHVPRERCAATIVALLAAVGFDTLHEHVTSPFAEGDSPKAQGARQHEVLKTVKEANGIDRNELIEELMIQHPRGAKGEKRKVYRRAIAAMLEQGILVERGGKVYPPGDMSAEDFSDLLGVQS